ncbi:electron carrier [Spatholobus suberectus]|nr:electron carrier [Spatholobus suberectus]
MKGVKGKFMKKLKSIKQIGYLKEDRILQLKASDGYVDFLPKIPSFNLHTPFVSQENKPEKIVQSCEKMQEKEPEIIDVAELMKDLEEEEDDDEMGLEDYNDNKENIGPCSQKPQQHHKGVSQNGNRAKTESKQRGVLEEKKSSPARADSNSNRKSPLLDTDIPSFRRPDLNSSSLFDPNLLAAFEQAVKEHARMTEEQRTARVEVESPQKVEDGDPDTDPLMFFEEKCPPGGDGTVIFYTTTLRGIRKTFEDCSKIRFLLQSFKILYFERDISMHKEFRDELWSSLDGKSVPPRLFVKGRYIGGAEEVLSLHEQGKLKKIFEGLPVDCSNGPCDACGGIRFVLCFKCNGSHKVIAENGQSNQCPQCNENGLIVCPYCC